MPSPVQIIAAGALVTREDGKLLLVKHRRRGWEFPGGQIENGESLPAGVMREVREETGVEARVIGFSGLFCTLNRHMTDWGEDVPPITNVDFRCEYISGEARVSPEHADIGWFAPEEALAAVTHPAIARRLRAMLDSSGRVAVCARMYKDAYTEEYLL